jgi:uncharacterized protein
MDGLAAPPREAVWRHHTARVAVEVVRFEAYEADGWLLHGHTTGFEEERAHALAWVVDVGPDWVTRQAVVRSLLDDAEVVLERTSAGEWTVDGVARPDLAGLHDVDLEASAVTNLLPVHREPLDRATPAPAAYVRLDLAVERLDQIYGPVEEIDGGLRVPYVAPRFGADFDLRLDLAGLVLDYPGLATRLR